jgi:hypothetical protein
VVRLRLAIEEVLDALLPTQGLLAQELSGLRESFSHQTAAQTNDFKLKGRDESGMMAS